MTNKGIDVSFAQGKIDWAKVKNSGNVNFAIIRAGFGRETSQEDSQFKNNYVGCKMNDIPVGAYWYSYAESVEDAKREAKACMEVIKGKSFEYPIFFDLEERFQFENGVEFCNNIVRAFCGELEKNGYYAGLYCSTSYLNNYISAETAKKYALWVAQYNNECTYTKTDHGMWQFTSEGRISGIGGNVDLDKCYVDYPTIIKAKGLNGFKASGSVKGDANKDGKVDVRDAATIAHSLSKGDKLPKSADYNGDGKSDVRDAAAIAQALSGHKKTVSEIAREVINGKWGNGEERKQRLTAAGYNYTEVQNAVNELI